MSSRAVVDVILVFVVVVVVFFFFQAEDGIRDLVRSRGLGDVYKRQGYRARTGMDKTENAAVSAPKKTNEERTLADAVDLSLIHI